MTAVSAISSIAVSAHQISAKLGNSEVLHQITLSLPAARWTSIVGPNGAGKSTLLKALAGLLPISGEVQLAGHPIAPKSWHGWGKTNPLLTI
jgi:iron complex transport system ATP-binding protein